MYQQFKTRNELEKFIQEEVCTVAEAQEILGVSRQEVNLLVEQQALYPIFSRDQATVFWRSDILQWKKELATKSE